MDASCRWWYTPESHHKSEVLSHPPRQNLNLLLLQRNSGCCGPGNRQGGKKKIKNLSHLYIHFHACYVHFCVHRCYNVMIQPTLGLKNIRKVFMQVCTISVDFTTTQNKSCKHLYCCVPGVFHLTMDMILNIQFFFSLPFYLACL